MELAFGLLVAYAGNAQSTQLTGPRAKNKLFWGKSQDSRIMVKDHDHVPVTGPGVKYEKSWEDDCEVYEMHFVHPEMVTGPQAKSRKSGSIPLYWDMQSPVAGKPEGALYNED